MMKVAQQCRTATSHYQFEGHLWVPRKVLSYSADKESPRARVALQYRINGSQAQPEDDIAMRPGIAALFASRSAFLFQVQYSISAQDGAWNFGGTENYIQT